MSAKNLAVEKVTLALVETCLEKSNIRQQAVKLQEEVAHLERLREEHQKKIKELSHLVEDKTVAWNKLTDKIHQALKISPYSDEAVGQADEAVDLLIKRYEANRENDT